jgi:alkyl hydroperoxide reductase subunit D
MNVIRTHGSDPVDFELWCLAARPSTAAASASNATRRSCARRVFSEETILAAVRVASIVHALATVMDAESTALRPAIPV